MEQPQTYEDLTAIAAMELFQKLRSDPIATNERVSASKRRAVGAAALDEVAHRNGVDGADVIAFLAAGMNPSSQKTVTT